MVGRIVVACGLVLGSVSGVAFAQATGTLGGRPVRPDAERFAQLADRRAWPAESDERL